MVTVVTVGVLAVLCASVVLARRRRRRRAAREMFVLTVPGIELDQPYGAWDAENPDAHRGIAVPRVRLLVAHGPPSTWGRVG